MRLCLASTAYRRLARPARPTRAEARSASCVSFSSASLSSEAILGVRLSSWDSILSRTACLLTRAALSFIVAAIAWLLWSMSIRLCVDLNFFSWSRPHLLRHWPVWCGPIICTCRGYLLTQVEGASDSRQTRRMVFVRSGQGPFIRRRGVSFTSGSNRTNPNSAAQVSCHCDDVSTDQDARNFGKWCEKQTAACHCVRGGQTYDGQVRKGSHSHFCPALQVASVVSDHLIC
ncbi:hypothetical protein FVE85_6632 [Porphyridium purpureum]|uniref:Uncharacterized protein n=1 Tax=Porphyridium purpureum TaxID=35688 RepID=A0A5J4Z8R5_PORPP|nr:hypothetical protein FVE85_6632 [Porphyridium purpureum]|eukprot:POR7444..scf295_1